MSLGEQSGQVLINCMHATREKVKGQQMPMTQRPARDPGSAWQALYLSSDPGRFDRSYFLSE